MPFFEHLVELRDRLRNASIAFAIGVIGAWFFSEEIYAWLRGPLDNAWIANKAELDGMMDEAAYGEFVKGLA